MAKKVKKADDVAAVEPMLFAKRISTWTYDYRGIEFTLKTLPSAVKTYITANALTYDPITKQTGADMSSLIYLTTKFACLDIKGLKSLVYDADDNPEKNEDGSFKTTIVKIEPGFYRIAGRSFPCIQDNILDQLPEEVLWAIYHEIEKTDLTEQEKEKLDFTVASNETK